MGRGECVSCVRLREKVVEVEANFSELVERVTDLQDDYTELETRYDALERHNRELQAEARKRKKAQERIGGDGGGREAAKSAGDQGGEGTHPLFHPLDPAMQFPQSKRGRCNTSGSDAGPAHVHATALTTTTAAGGTIPATSTSKRHSSLRVAYDPLVDENDNDLGTVILRICDKRSAHYAASFAMRALDGDGSGAQQRWQRLIALYAQVGKATLRKVLGSVSLKGKKGVSAIRECIHEYAVAPAIAAKAAEVQSDGVCEDERPACGTTTNLPSPSTEERERVSRFLQLLHASWWSTKESIKACTHIWLIEFVCLLESWSKAAQAACAPPETAGRDSLASTVVEVFLMDCFEQLDSAFDGGTSLGKKHVRMGAVMSFVAGLCRILEDKESYARMAHAVMMRWLTARSARDVFASATMELLYVTAANVWDDAVAPSSRKSAAVADVNVNGRAVAGNVYALVHAELSCDTSTDARRAAARADIVDTIAYLLCEFEALAARVIEDSQCGGASLSSTGQDEEKERLERIGRELELCCTTLGWKKMHELNVLDRLIPVVIGSGSVAALHAIVVPLLDIAVEEDACENNKDLDNFKKVQQLSAACKRLTSIEESAGIVTASAFRRELGRRFHIG